MEFKVGDIVRWPEYSSFGLGEVLGVDGVHAQVRFRDFHAYEDSDGDGSEDCHVPPTYQLKLVPNALQRAAIKNTADSFELSRDWDERTNFHEKVIAVLKGVEELLVEKNDSYGDSALNPARIFSKADSVEQLKVRIDDKLTRVQRGNDYGEDTITDLIGYLTLLKIAEGEK